jgi:hypothetical protein
VLLATIVALAMLPDGGWPWQAHSVEFGEDHNMAVRIGIMVLRLVVLGALVLGVLFWTNVIDADTSGSLVDVHRTLGILTVLVLWFLAFSARRVAGITGLVMGAYVLGLVVAVWGFAQQSILPEPNALHWVVQVVHLLFGLAAIGLGEMIAARFTRAARAMQPATQQAG